jgi:hypothetical protein
MNRVRPASALRSLAVLGAWLSPAIPVLVVALVLWGARDGPYPRGESRPFLAAALACLAGLLSGVAGVALGVRARNKILTLPPAILGLLLNAGVVLLALLLYGLSGLPGP